MIAVIMVPHGRDRNSLDGMGFWRRECPPNIKSMIDFAGIFFSCRSVTLRITLEKVDCECHVPCLRPALAARLRAYALRPTPIAKSHPSQGLPGHSGPELVDLQESYLCA